MPIQTATILQLPAVRQEIDNRLAKLYATQGILAAQIDPMHEQLMGELKTFIARGGKRIRPYLTYLGYIGHGGHDQAAILDVAVSQELLHNFMLIHDDIIDRDMVRYGGPNISGVYTAASGSRHYGDSVAILAGDINHTLAHQAISRSNFSPARRLAALDRLDRMTLEVVGGELIDVALPHLEETEITEELLLRMMRYKTASYSFEAPLQIGAIMSGASTGAQSALSGFAIPAGIAFQLQDDLLGMFGDEAVTGKPVVGDLREGKQTLLMRYGLEMAETNERKFITKCLGNADVTTEDLHLVQSHLTTSGAKAKIETLAAQYANQALVALQRTSLNDQSKTILAELMGALTTRRK